MSTRPLPVRFTATDKQQKLVIDSSVQFIHCEQGKYIDRSEAEGPERDNSARDPATREQPIG
jgi:hypothetical protein